MRMEVPILIFDIEGEYGHFRKYNTTTSPLTYSIPPRTAVVGILGAILGIKREHQPGIFPDQPVQELFNKQNAWIAIQILNSVKKVNVGFNLIDTKKHFFDLTKAKHTQINFELLKNPKFRIFVHLKDENYFSDLEERLKQKKFVYTPYFGLAQFIANIEFVGKTSARLIENNNEYVEIITALNLNKIQGIEEPLKFDYNFYYVVNNMYLEMDRNREVSEYADVLIERNGKPILAKVKQYYRLSEKGNIVFL